MDQRESISLSGTHHLGVIVKDIEKTMEYYEKNFSCTFQTPPESGTERTRVVHHKGALLHGKPTDYAVKIAFTKLGPMYIEFVQPLEGRSHASEFLETHGEGIQHVALMTDDIKAGSAKMEKLGFSVLAACDEPQHPSWAYFDTNKMGGIMFELIQLTRRPR